MTRRLAQRLFAALLLVTASAGAQGNSAIAESLFRDGKKLLERKRYDEACPKFAESARLDPSSGVELALGLCYEGQGKTASAWGAFVNAASLARRDGRHDREQAATHHAAALEGKLPRVTLTVAAETLALSGLVVKQDGVVLGSETWKGAPADPGSHTLEAEAPGKRPFSMKFTIGPSEETSVNVPALEDLPPAGPAPAIASSAPPESSHLGRDAGYVVAGAGTLSLLIGTVLGIVALHDASSAHSSCPKSPCSNAQGVAENGTAGTFADWSTGTLIAGGLGVLAGAGLVFFLPPSKEAKPAEAASVTPVLGLGFAGVKGTF